MTKESPEEKEMCKQCDIMKTVLRSRHFFRRHQKSEVRSRLRLQTNWGGSGSRQKKAVPAPYFNIFHFELLKTELLM